MVKWNPNSLLNAPGNWNPLVYAANDPVNFVDPSGLAVQVPASIVGLGIGAIVGGTSEALMSSKTGLEYAKDIGKGVLVGGTTGFFAGLTSGVSLLKTVGIGAGLGALGTTYRLSLDNKNIMSNTSYVKIGTSAFLGALTGGLSALAPNAPEKFMSIGLSLGESFFGGGASATIDMIDQIHSQQQNYLEKLNKL